jgi:hypothetical protein
VRYEPVHYTIVSLDVVRSGTRDDQLLLRMRAELRTMITDAFVRQGLDPADIDSEDLGDGVRLIVPARVTPARLLDPFVPHLAAALREHRKTAAEAARLRLRVAVHMGLLHRDAGGWAGAPLVLSARLLDAPPLRRVLDVAERADLAVIVSGDVYEKVVRHGYGLDPAAYHRVEVAVKETRASAWIHVPGYPAPPGLQSGTATEPAPSPTRPSTHPHPARSGGRRLSWLRLRLRLAFGTRRAGVRFLWSFLGAFGVLIGAATVLCALVWSAPPSLATVAVSALSSLVWATARACARSGVTYRFQHPDMTVTVRIGDLFDEDAHLVVGFTDTFDTSVVDDRIISRTALQGQLVQRCYGGDHRSLDRELALALARHTPVGVEKRDAKRWGKLTRYPIGTVAVLGRPERHTFAVAYSRMGNDLVPRSSVHDLWLSLSSLWDAVYEHGQRAPVAMPVVGSGAARIDQLGPQSLVEMILLSFVARSREIQFCRELRIVIRPVDLRSFDLPELAAFLRRL